MKWQKHANPDGFPFFFCIFLSLGFFFVCHFNIFIMQFLETTVKSYSLELAQHWDGDQRSRVAWCFSTRPLRFYPRRQPILHKTSSYISPNAWGVGIVSPVNILCVHLVKYWISKFFINQPFMDHTVFFCCPMSQISWLNLLIHLIVVYTRYHKQINDFTGCRSCAQHRKAIFHVSKLERCWAVIVVSSALSQRVLRVPTAQCRHRFKHMVVLKSSGTEAIS